MRGFKPTSHAKVCIWNQNWVIGFFKEPELNYDFCLEDIVKGQVFSKAEKGALSRGGYGSYKAVANEFQVELMVPS